MPSFFQPNPIDAMQIPRGKLKIFFGADAGVGKSFAMLELAAELRTKGMDVVVGWIDVHGRPGIAYRLDGFEILAPASVPASNGAHHEFDLDGALIRRPQLLVLDKLAHANPPGFRHTHRWYDVEELLNAGIDVLTTLNVQQLESLNEEIARITGLREAETVPDVVFDQADEIKLIDLPPDELQARMKAGKVYLPVLSGHAIQHFYRKGLLIVMRQFALRRTSEWVEAHSLAYLRETAEPGQPVRPISDRIMVCIGPGEDGGRLIILARRLAASLHAPWIAIHVETPRLQRLTQAKRKEVLRLLSLAEQFGGESMVISGSNVSSELLRFALSHGINKVVFGKPHRRGWRRWLFGSVSDTVITESVDIDFYIGGVEDDRLASASPRKAAINPEAEPAGSYAPLRRRYLKAAGISLMLVLGGLPFRNDFDPFAFAILIATGVFFAALHLGRNPSILAALMSTVGFAYFYAPPHSSFLLTDMEDLVTLSAMSTVAIITSRLVDDFRMQTALASLREQYTKSLYKLSRELAETHHEEETLQVAVRHLSAEFHSACTILLPDDTGRLHYPKGKPLAESLVGKSLLAAQWAFDQGKTVGHGTDTLRDEPATYIPLKGSAGVIGALIMKRPDAFELTTTEHKLFFESSLQQIATAIARVQAVATANQVSVQIEKEILRNSLLSSISHDLRTPLTAIFGASCVLEEKPDTLTAQDRYELARVIREQTQRMSNLTDKILDMVKLSGEVVLHREWHYLDEVVSRSLKILEIVLRDRPVKVDLPESLTLVYVDATLLQQVFVNVIENANRYSPPSLPIEISAWAESGRVIVDIEDSGPGIAAGMEKSIFEKFVSVPVDGAPSGVGLGLNICKTVIEAHGGTISASTRAQGGSRFRFELPLPGDVPNFDMETDA